jgi:Rrf2 family protein
MRHLAAQVDREAVSAREVAEAYDIPPELLAKVLQRLVRFGLLASHQGIRGGYALARPARTMTVADVIQAIDGPLTVTACSDVDHSCDQYSKCNIRDPLWKIKDRITAALAATSVAELAADLSHHPPAGVVPMAVVRK